MGLHMGICRGPVDELVAIKAGDREIWKYDPSAPPLPSSASFAAYDTWKASGLPLFLMPSIAEPAYYYVKDDRVSWPTQVNGNTTLRIKAANIFGGEESEGGIDGTLDVMFGADDQPVNSRLQQMLGGLVPAYRKRFTVFFDGMVCAMSKYPKPWAFRIRRNLNGWDGGVWYPEKCIISLDSGKIKARNPSHLIYECLTNRDWGRGIPRAKLDDAAFRAAADVLFTENFGLCLKWSRQDKIGNFIQLVLNHAGANLFPSRTTGLWTLRLVREDYDVNTLPSFDADTGLLGIDEDDNAADVVGANDIVVNFIRPVDNSEGSVRIQNAAAVRAAGGLLPESVDYPGIPTDELALRVAQRDLRAKFGLKKFKVRLDRRGYKIEPGGVFRVSDASRGIENLVLRAGRIDDGTLSAGTITISAVMDVFGLPANSYVAVQPPLYTPPNFTPEPVAHRLVAEATYRDLVGTVDAATFAAITPGTNFITAMGAAPTGMSYAYQLGTRVVSGGEWNITEADFTPTAITTTAIEKGAVPVTVSLADLVRLEAVSVGSAAVINGEIFRVTVLNLETKTATLARGCIDTVPAAHPIGSRIWFYQDGNGVDTTEYASGVTVQVQMLSKTGAGILSGEIAPIDSHVVTRRRERPYPPGNLKINGASYPAKISGALSISWAHRDRTIQADQLIDTAVGSIGPEAGTVYTLSVLGDGVQIGPVAETADSSFSLPISVEKSKGLFHLPHNLIMRSPGLAPVVSTESENLQLYPVESAGFYQQQFAKVDAGWLSFNNIGSTNRGVYVDSATGSKTVRNFDLASYTRRQIFTLNPSVPKLDDYFDRNYNGWASYWESPSSVNNEYVADYTGLSTLNTVPPFKDRRINPGHIVLFNYGFASLRFSAQTYNDKRGLNYITYGLYVVQKNAVKDGPMAISRTDVESFFISSANQFDSLTGTAPAIPPFMPSDSVLRAFDSPFLIYETGVIYGSLLYLHYHRGTGSATTAGKTLDITNVLSSGHLSYKTGSELITKIYTIDSAGALTPLTTRMGFYLADQINGTHGVEISYSSRNVNLVNATTGVVEGLLGTLTFDPCAVYVDIVNELIYILSTDGTLRKFDITLTLLASVFVGTSDRFLPWKLRRSDIKESASYLYVRFAGVTYEVKKDLSSSRLMLGYYQTYPGYADPASTIVLLSNEGYGLADESGISSSVFNQPTPRVAAVINVDLNCSRLGLDSHQSHSISTVRTAYGLRYGKNYRG